MAKITAKREVKYVQFLLHYQMLVSDYIKYWYQTTIGVFSRENVVHCSASERASEMNYGTDSSETHSKVCTSPSSHLSPLTSEVVSATQVTLQ